MEHPEAFWSTVGMSLALVVALVYLAGLPREILIWWLIGIGVLAISVRKEE